VENTWKDVADAVALILVCGVNIWVIYQWLKWWNRRRGPRTAARDYERMARRRWGRDR
jgi:hypothetical protein